MKDSSTISLTSSQKLYDDYNDLEESLSDNDNDDLEELLSDNDNDDLEKLLSDNDDLEELLSDIDNNNLKESLSEMSIDEDVIDDSNKTELSESMVLVLRLLNLKCKHNFTNNAFTDILNLIGSDLGEGSTLYLTKERLNRLVNLKLKHVDMCKNSCCAFMRIYINDVTCRFCNSEKYIISHNSKKPQKPQKLQYELKILQEGVSIYDAVLKESFILQCHVVMWTGDMPAISKLMCMTGHNAYLGYRFCYLKGVYSEKSRHVYFPCSMPRTSNITDFDPKELSKRTKNNFLNDISKIINETNRITRLSYIKETGINGRSILFGLKSIKFPRSFPVDIMHLFFKNIFINMFKH
ncbi:hypothetical protein RclHR1_03460003 [Rhizophagus clarus]|uniref:Transposase domain-containing protein n=1 Tax=Rhizophagus clarus TaxID=94130 RepID=A0A2Z6RM10_9GLOM|nr:hypothetical protein RclHR1_03460003 [Rhizophagus clarus]